MNRLIPIVMCNDIEPDGYFIDRTRRLPWRGYEACHEYFSRLRPLLEKATGNSVHYSWYFRFDPQVEETYGSPIWPVTNYPHFVEDFIKGGDEIAIHTHAYRWMRNMNNWIIDQGDQAWVESCVKMCFEGYRQVFGKNCDSFRFGDAWMNNAALHLVEELGARFDLTVEPGHTYPSEYLAKRRTTGFYLDCDFMPRVPYRPSKEDFRYPDPDRKDGIWVIPVSTGKFLYQYGRTERFVRSFLSPKALCPQPASLNVGNGDHRFRIIAEEILNSSNHPYLVLVLRTNALIHPLQRKNVEGCFDYLLNHRLAKQFVFTTTPEMMQVLGYLESNGHAKQEERLAQ